MKITFADLAQIIMAIRDTEDFDGMNGTYEFMDKLDENGEREIEINQPYGLTVFKIDMEE